MPTNLKKLESRTPFPHEIYFPNKPGPKPLICITPLLGRLVFLEDLFFERQFAQYFARKGFAVLLVDRPIFEFDERRGLDQMQTYLESSISRSHAVLDQVIKNPEIDPQRIGSFGISFGSIINCLWASRDARLKANVFALTGGNLPEIFLTSRDPLMRSYLTSARKIFKGKKKHLRHYLKEIFKLEPLELAPRIQDRKNLMILGVFDRIVGFQYGLALRKAMGKPATWLLPFGHYGAILASPLLKPGVVAFFRKNLR